MLSKIVLESYLEEINKGVKTLRSYNYAFQLISYIIASASFFALFLLGVNLLDKGFFDDISMTTLGSILTQYPDTLMFGYIGAGSLLLSVLVYRLHVFMLKRKMKKYIKDNHEIIVYKHTNIFKDHSKEAIEAFSQERDKSILLSTLNTQIVHMVFVLNNYENLSGQEETSSYDVDAIDEEKPDFDVDAIDDETYSEEEAEIIHPDEEIEKI